MAQASRRGSRSVDGAYSQRRVELERALVDAERVMMQTVQTSLSLIGFGFTITEFFSGKDLPVQGAPQARRVGEALLVLGLLLLGMGIWAHTRYRQRLIQAFSADDGSVGYGLHLRDTPSFVIAILLLLVGFATLMTVVFRRLF